MFTNVYIILLFCPVLQCCRFPENDECEYMLDSDDDQQALNISTKVKDGIMKLTIDCECLPMGHSDRVFFIFLDGSPDCKKTKSCSTEIKVKGDSKTQKFCFKVIPFSGEKCELFSKHCIDFEKTFAENVSCMLYNVSSVTCTWKSGERAPPDTTYILSLKGQENKIKCKDYHTNLEERTGACTFNNLPEEFSKKVTVILEGSNPAIEIYEEEIDFLKTETFNPPRNINITSSGHEIQIRWQQPQTNYYVNNDCFHYEIEMNKEKFYRSETMFSKIHLQKDCFIRIRAKGNECGLSDQWGRWSKTHECGISVKEERIFVLLICSVLVSTTVLVFIIIITVHYKRMKNRCCPKIPKPKNYLDSPGNCKIHKGTHTCFSPILPRSEV